MLPQTQPLGVRGQFLPKRFLPFGRYSPDSNDRDVPDMEQADNALPVFGSYRSLRKKIQSSEQDVGGSPSHVAVHFYTKLISSQNGYPVDHANNSDGVWVAIGGDPDVEDLYAKIDDRVPDDGDRIVAGDAPSSATALFKLNNLETPVAGDRKIKYRYNVSGVSGTWTLDIALKEPDDGSTYSESITQVTGTADTDNWEEGEFTLVNTASITDWDDLYIEVVATVPGDGDQVGYCEADFYNPDLWENESGATTGLHESIDETTPVDNTYIQSPVIRAGENSSVIFDLDETLTDPVIHSGHKIEYREKANAEKLKGKLELIEEGDVIASNETDELTTSYVGQTLNLTAAEAAEIKRYDNLKIKYTVSAGEDVGDSSSTTENYPSQVIGTTVGTWTASAGTQWEAVGDNTDTLQSAPNGNRSIKFRLSSATDPGTNKNHKLIIRLKGDVTSTESIWVQLIQGGTQILDGTYPVNASIKNRYYLDTETSQTTNTYSLSTTEAARITNYGILDVLVFSDNTSVTFDIEKIYLEVDEQRSGFLSQVKWTLPDEARMEVSRMLLETPTDHESSVGDVTEIYLGVPEKIYSVASSGFTDVSRSSGPPAYQDLSSTGEYAHSWDSCSWGTDILWTNYVDPLQKKAPADSAFSDAITGTQKPQGRFVAPISNHVVLGKIKFISATHGDGTQPDGESDEVWWSAQEDYADFDPDVSTQCDRQRIYWSPGEITGLVGGSEYGFVFKANSIERMSFVGSPLIMRFDGISQAEGTRFNRSIVKAMNNVYFFGNSGFFVIENGETLRPIGDGQVTKTFVDEEFEANAISIQPSDETIQQETLKESAVIGTYDRLTRLIIWSVRLKDDDDFQNSGLVVYNPVEDRFGFFNIGNLNLCSINSFPVSKDVGDLLTRNIFAMGLNGTTASYVYFNRDVSYDITLKTKVLSSAYVTGSDRYIGQNITIDMIRPIYRSDPNFSIQGISIKLEVSDDELMLENVDSDTVTLDDANKDKWFPFEPMSGEFFQITVTVTSFEFSSIKEFDGVTVNWVGDSGF